LSLKSNTLLTRRFDLLGWSEYKLVDSGVTVREKDIKGIREVTIEYDRIGKEAKYFVHRSVKAILALVLFALLSAATAVVNFMHGDASNTSLRMRQLRRDFFSYSSGSGEFAVVAFIRGQRLIPGR
jgi:hypothetical protein